ncbi:MAG: RNA polymerase sigma factor [Clostridia bacterium]
MKDELIIIQKAMNGDTSAFELLVKEYQKMVFNVAYKILRDREDAADATQEAFIKAYKAITSFRQDSKFSTWVCSIVTNACYDILRKSKRNKTQSLYYENDEEENQIPLPDDDNEVDPIKVATNSELREYLLKAIEELESEHRDVVILRELNDYSYQEISNELDISIGTVKSRLSRARLKIIKKLRKEPELLPYDLRQKT